MSKTLQQLAVECIHVQDACNLVAVVKGFDRVLAALQEAGVARVDLDTHPITRCWIDKITNLCGVQNWGDDGVLSAAHDAVEQLAKGNITNA